MISREKLCQMLESSLKCSGARQEAAEEAYRLLAAGVEFDDPLVEDVLLHLVSFHAIGEIFAEYRPDAEKLSSFLSLLRDELSCLS